MTPTAEPRILDLSEPAGRGAHVAVGAIGEAARAEADVALVRLAQRGDTAAFDRLAADRVDAAFRLAAAILRSEPDARDAVQDAFVSAWRRLPTLRDPASFDAWLGRIIVNACRMLLRHQRTVRLREIDVGDVAQAADAPLVRDAAAGIDDEVGNAVADADLVTRAFARLDGEKRAILVLRHVEERSVADIAAVLGIPAGTAKWRLHVARSALDRALEEESR